MIKYLKTYGSFALISFTGSLPPGITNIAATQIAIGLGAMPAIFFSIGSAAAEAIYVRIALVAMSWLQKKEKLVHILQWASVLMLYVLAYGSLSAAFTGGTEKSFLLNSTIPTLLFGFLISLVSPKQGFFWFGVIGVMYEKGKLNATSSFYNAVNLGVATGTIAANLLYIFGGVYFSDFIKKYEPIMNGVVGLFFLVMAIISTYQQLKKKD